MKVAKDTAAKNKVLANIAKKSRKATWRNPRELLKVQHTGIKPTERSVKLTAAGQEAGLMKPKS